ncbi:uncharacterized protein [Phyllobates terribilis]|uniref:uncharacterized protein n=1 Tax=Phyllobates terribilis TaxID=111132 RepID=UPI003CCA85B2
MEFVRNMERRRLIKPQDILATLQSIPEDESESELQEHVFDSDSDEDFIPQNISSESEDSEGTNPEDIPSTSTGDRAHAVILPRDHPPGRGQKKSAKRPRNERTTDNDGGEGNATTNTREGESEGILVSADGIQWKPVEIGEHLPGRRDSQNILREAPGPTGYARRNIIIDSPLSAWRLFFNSYILTHIKNCTLAEACRNNNLQFTLSDEELDAFIAIFYARGISGTNRDSISSIWCNDWGIPFCKATMSRDRFVEIMRFLRFDEKSTRSERLQTDKFALFSTVWDRFIENCIACYKPGPYITVDEQLFPSKTRCPFTQYMPSKPDKYGHKYWLAVDKRSKYLANGFPYLGKDDTRRAEDRLADHVVMKLLDPFLKKGRNVTTDNYFTSVKLAKQLKSKGTTIVGTLNKIRREVPKEIKSMKEELYNTKVFRNEDNFTLTVYQGKPNKNVVILSSVHPDVVVASDLAKKTPETSSWLSPIVLVPKPDGEWRFCNDYRKLNEVAKYDAYPMQCIHELVEQLGPARYIATLDLTKRYWEVPMAQGAKEKAAFSTPDRCFQYVRMPFGLQGAPATFHRTMDRILVPHKKYAVAYLDIFIFSPDWESHLEKVQAVFNALKKTGFSINPNKCAMGKEEAKYHEYIVGRGEIKPQISKVEAI